MTLQDGITVCEQFNCPGLTEPAHFHYTVTADVTDQTGTLENLEVREPTRRLFLTIFKLITLAVELPLKGHARPPKMVVVSAEEHV